MATLVILAAQSFDVSRWNLEKNVSFMAVSLAAMETARQKKIVFYVPEDVLSWTELAKEAPDFIANAIEWMEDLDDILKPLVHFDRSFSANGYWFLSRLCNIHYLHALATRIEKEFDSVHIVTDFEIPRMVPPEIDLNSLDLRTCGVGTPHVLKILQVLTNATHEVSMLEEAQNVSWRRETWNSLLRRLPAIMLRRMFYLIKKFSAYLRPKFGTLLVVQEGYEVEQFRARCPRYKYDTSSKDLWIDFDKHDVVKVTPNIVEEIRERSINFFDAHLPGISIWLLQLITAYTGNVVSYIPNVRTEIDLKLRKANLSGVLFSKGSETVVDTLICEEAIRQSKPIFFFKHGGIENLFVKPSQRDLFFELNPRIERTQFVFSEIDFEFYREMGKISAVKVGRMERATKTKISKRSERKILYCFGAPAHSTYKDMLTVTSDFERWKFARQVIQSCIALGLRLDIKPHPLNWERDTAFVNLIINQFSSKMNLVRIAQGGAVERAFSNYELVIFDALRSKAFSAALSVNVAVILYLPDRFDLQQSALEDLHNRVYVTSNFLTLQENLGLFQLGELPSLWTSEFVEKYFGSTDAEVVFQRIKKQIIQGSGIT